MKKNKEGSDKNELAVCACVCEGVKLTHHHDTRKLDSIEVAV